MNERDFVTRGEFETWQSIIKDEFDFRDRMSKRDASFNEKFEKLFNRNAEIMKEAIKDNRNDNGIRSKIFDRENDVLHEIKRELSSIKTKFEILLIMLTENFILLVLIIIALLAIEKKIGG